MAKKSEDKIENLLPRLRPYQDEIALAIAESILGYKGLTFTVEIARQGGKNELSARLELYLLTGQSSQAVNIVKCAPTFKPQCLISMRRLADRLNDAGYAGAWYTEAGHIIRLGQSRAVFLSAEEGANVVGNTAHLLLEVDEAQDVPIEKYNKDFRPMAAVNNTTTVLYGTTWHGTTLLEEVKQANLELEKDDGIRRHFRYDWEDVAACIPDYRAYVEAERRRLGEEHPLFMTQYRLLAPREGSGLFTRTQLALLKGGHSRLTGPESGKTYVAGIDIAGEADAADPRSMERRDRTVVTIAEVDGSGGKEFFGGPEIRVVEHYAWRGASHTDLLPQLIHLLDNRWKCKKVAVDATGMGEPIAFNLKGKLKSRVECFKFTSASKSELGYTLLAAINSARLKLYRGETVCMAELEMAEARYRDDQRMNFFVDPSRGHDDYLMSLALCLYAAQGYRERKARG